MFRRQTDAESEPLEDFLHEETAAQRRQAVGQLLRWSIAFAGLFAAVFLCFWWSGAAIRFGAARVSENPTATWTVAGTVVDAETSQAIPWAAVTDDESGRPPYYRTDAGMNGEFVLLTLAEPHLIRVSAVGYHSRTVRVGRQWFTWWPHGEERFRVALIRDIP